MKKKKYTHRLTEEDLVDITLIYEKKQIIKFALNYRGKILGKWYPIYRVDNCHGFLHEQKLWRTKEPIPLNETIPTDLVFDKYSDFIDKNFKKLKSYFKETMRK